MTLTLQEVEKYLQKYRKRGERTVSLLGKYKEFIDAEHGFWKTVSL